MVDLVASPEISPLFDPRASLRPSKGNFDLDATLNIDELHAAFADRGRVLIPRVLRADGAIRLSRFLAAELEWGLSLESGGRRRLLCGSARPDLSQLQLREIFEAAYSNVGRSHSHLYETISLGAYDDKRSPAAGTLYTQFCHFINSDVFLRFVRAVSGIPEIHASNPVACRYSRGHFYAMHMDENGGEGHRLSFVLNLTPFWMPQWGGLLQFRAQRGEVEEAYVPCFNSMSLFVASQLHSVSLVGACAPHPRLSIAGALIEPERKS